MIKLLQVELKKIFNKKSIYIIWGLMVIFCLLNNILYKTDYDENGNYKYSLQENLETEQIELEEELKKYNKEDLAQVTMYITVKTKLDIIKLKQNYIFNSWQYKKINSYLYDIFYKINYYKYVENDVSELNKLQKECNEILERLNNDDYLYFLEIEIQNKIYIIDELREKYYYEIDEKSRQELKKQIDASSFDLLILKYRLKNNIREDDNYLNIALENYQENYKTVEYYDKRNNKNIYQEKLAYQEALSELEISKYIIEHKQNINQQNNLNYQLRTIVEDYEIFIVILILIVCSTIICDEFKDGTIKLLLIKPYSRGKILLSKYFTAIIVIGISILVLIAMQLIIGGIIFGFDSLDMPVVVYDFYQLKLVEYSVFRYMMIRIIAKIPFLLMLITISFLLGLITSSTIFTISIPLLLYMFTPTVIYMTTQYQLEFTKYLVNINWDLQGYLFGRLPQISFINFNFSLIVLLIYFIILWIVMFIVFEKKDIKNI